MDITAGIDKEYSINKFLKYSLLLFFALFVVFSPYSKIIGKITLWGSMFFWLIINAAKFKQKFYRVFFLPKYLNLTGIIFLASIFLSTIFSLDVYHSQRVLVNHYSGYLLIFFLGLFIIRSLTSSFLLESLFILSGAIISLGGLWDYLRLHSRLLSSFGIPVNLVSYLLIFIPVNYAIVLFSKNKWLKLVAIINLLLLFFCLLMNASNTAICSIFGVLIFITFFKGRKWTVFLALFFLILGIIAAFYYGKYIVADLRNDILNRLGLWKTACKIFEDFPVLGSGLGMFEKLANASKYVPLEGYRDGNRHLHAHSVYLEVLAETGILGLAAFCSVFIVFFKDNLKVIKNLNDDKKALFLGALGVILSNLFLGLSSSIITVGFMDVLMFWLIFGMAAGLSDAGIKI